MSLKLLLHVGDVTLLPEGGAKLSPSDSPGHDFILEQSDGGYRLTFDGRGATVPQIVIKELLGRIGQGSSVEWVHSRDVDTRRVFRPLDRILACLSTTPAYQLFMAGFNVADAVGFFDDKEVEEPQVKEAFGYLAGPVMWDRGKRGQLFFLPDNSVDAVAREELIANSKLGSVDLYASKDEGEGWSHEGTKLYVPYATPIGFTTTVQASTEAAWQAVVSRMGRRKGGRQ